MGKSIVSFISEGRLIHLGPHFPTLFRQTTATSPDKVFCNKHNYLNTFIQQGDITSSDHIPVLLTVSTRPIYLKSKETYQYNRANWEKFQEILNDRIEIKTLNNYASVHTHKPIYQTVTTPYIKQLEIEYNTLRNNAVTHGWTNNTYREHNRIRYELRERCKEAHNHSWEDKINNIIQISNNPKDFWNKIKLLRGNKYRTY